MLCIIKVWECDMICKPERLVDSDEKPGELLWLSSRVALVIRAITGGAAESETWTSQSGLGCWKRQTCVVLVWRYKVSHKCWLWNNMWYVIVGLYKEVVNDCAEIYIMWWTSVWRTVGFIEALEKLSSDCCICSGETRCDCYVISSGVRIVSEKARFRSLDSLRKSPVREFG